MGNLNQSLRERYMTSFDDVVEDMPIARKLEVYQGLQEQASLLTQLDDRIVKSLDSLAVEEASLREREDFLERRRLSYMKRIDPSSSHEDDDDDDDEDEEEEEESQGEKENEAENKNPQIQAVVSEKDDEEALGSIAVLDGPSEQKKQEIKTFLEQELPEIQKNVAVRARMLWFKRKEYDDKLVDTRGKLAEVKGLIAELEPGLPPLNSEGGIALVPSV